MTFKLGSHLKRGISLRSVDLDGKPEMSSIQLCIWSRLEKQGAIAFDNPD